MVAALFYNTNDETVRQIDNSYQHAFDTLCQSLLIARYDMPDIQAFIEQKASIPLFNIVNILKTSLI